MNAAHAGQLEIAGFPCHRLGFGTSRLVGPGVWGPAPDADESRAILRQAFDLGVNHFDTADSYGPEHAERLVHDALGAHADSVLIASKGGFERTGPNRWVPNGRPEHLRDACEGSLRRLGVDAIGLYYLHTPDPGVPLIESVEALRQLQRDGKILHIGLSNVNVAQINAARKKVEIVAVQNRYNQSDRGHAWPDRKLGGNPDKVLHCCEANGLPFIPVRPLEAGKAAQNLVVTKVAAQLHAKPEQVALAWLLSRSPNMAPIPGTGSMEHLKENIAAADLDVTEFLPDLDAYGERSGLYGWVRHATETAYARFARRPIH